MTTSTASNPADLESVSTQLDQQITSLGHELDEDIAQDTIQWGWEGEGKLIGPTLIRGAEQAVATAGDTVTFKTLVLNESDAPLHNVQFVPVSLSSAKMNALSYSPPLTDSELSVGTLHPGAIATLTTSYCVTEWDVVCRGPLSSIVAVSAETADGTLLSEERDVRIEIR